jgi:hypothetical protein
MAGKNEHVATRSTFERRWLLNALRVTHSLAERPDGAECSHAGLAQAAQSFDDQEAGGPSVWSLRANSL